jgi:hypothetical protein
MTSKVLTITASAFIALLAADVFLFNEHWTTPGDELRIILVYHDYLTNKQEEYFSLNHSYADLRQLYGSMANPRHVAHDCQNGYCFEVKGGVETYSISIFPDVDRSSKGIKNARHMSLYSDQTKVIRMAYGSRAGEMSRVLKHEFIRRFAPK